VYISFILFLPPVGADTAYDIYLIIDKNVYCINESIDLYGEIYLGGAPFDGTGEKIDLFLYKAAAPGESEVQEDSELGLPISSSGNFSTSDLASSHHGKHKIVAKYTDANTGVWEAAIDFLVLPKCVDRISVYPDKADYYPGEQIEVTVEALKKLKGESVGVGDVSINGTMRYPNKTIIDSFSCITDGFGLCTVELTAPPGFGEYLLEANDFAGKTTFSVVPFDVVVTMKDETGQAIKSIFTTGQTAMVEVKVSFNGTAAPSGTYAFQGKVVKPDGTIVKTIPSTSISNTTYIGTYLFDIDSNFTIGSYMVNLTITNGVSVPVITFFDVRSWKLSVEKTGEDSGFLFGYTSFPGATVNFIIKVTQFDGTPLTSLEQGNFDIKLESSLGVALQTLNASNYSNSSKGYFLSFDMPSQPGTYSLKVKVTYKGDTLFADKALTVTDLVAYATPTDREGQLKEIFGGSEYIYIKVTAENSTTEVPITDLELSRVRDEEGNPLPYNRSNWTEDDNTSREWRANATTAMLKLDNPKKGGFYTVEVLINNRSAKAETGFLVDPYNVMAHPEDASGNHRWQFSTDETVYFKLTVTEAQHKSGSAMVEFQGEMMMDGGSIAVAPVAGWGKAGGGTPVVGANITVLKVINDLAFEEIPLSEINISCTQTDSNGKAACTLIPADGTWQGGWYHVIFEVTGPDGITTGRGFGGFEAKSFHIYADPVDEYGNYKWMHQPGDNLTFKVYMFDAKNSFWWWMQEGGLNGKVSVEKILYHGSPGEWLWPPVEYSYEGTLPTANIKDGKGNFTIAAPSDGWDSGSYSLVLKGVKIEGGNITGVDYGTAWFEVRLWDVWASPVDGDSYGWRESFSPDENITLFVNIHNAGSWIDNVELTGKPVTVDVRKIQDFSSWPPKELDPSEYTVYPIVVNKSGSQWGELADKAKYVLKIEPKTTWDTGYYNVVLNVSGANVTATETGWGWFSVISFYASAQFVDENGTQIWSSKGGKSVYFNLTSTKSPWYPWSGVAISDANPINTTIKEIVLRTWSKESWFPTELRYPGDLTVYPIEVNGTATVQVNKSDGTWKAGWYDGEIVLEDVVSKDTATAWVWFEIRPFVVKIENAPWQVSSSSNISLDLKIVDPATQWWYEPTILPGNYTITSITENIYGMWEVTQTEITTYFPKNFTTGSTPLDIAPLNGSWSLGWHSLKIEVTDENNNTGVGWLGFEVVSYKVEVLDYNYTIKPGDDLTVTLNITDPSTSIPVNGTVVKVYEWVWDPAAYASTYKEYDFTPATIEGVGDLIISAPTEGWTEGYHSLTIEFEGVSQWVWFEVRSFTGWAYPESYSYGKADDVTMWLYVYESDWITPAKVNVTKVEYVNWAEVTDWYYIQYKEANFTVNEGVDNTIDGKGTITLQPPEDNWSGGWYDVRIHVVGFDDPDVKAAFTGWFEIAQPTIWVSFPYGGEVLSGIETLSASVDNDPSGIVNTVEFYHANGNETLIGSDTYDYDNWYSIKWDTYEVENGEYRIIVRGKDSNGDIIAEAQSGWFTVYNLAPPDAKFSGKSIEFQYGVNESVTVVSGTEMEPTHADYSKFLKRTVTATVVYGDIKFQWGTNDLDDDGIDEWSRVTAYDNALYAINETGIMFDANGDGDVKDADDYTIYNLLYVLDAYCGDVFLVYNLTEGIDTTYSLYPDTVGAEGNVYEIKGSKYAVTAVKSDNEIEMGPAIRKSLADCSVVSPDCAITVSGTLKILYNNDTDSLYFYDGSSLVEQITGITDGLVQDISDNITADEFRPYKTFVKVNPDGSVARITLVEKAQIASVVDSMNDVFGYSEIYIDLDGVNPAWAPGGAGIYLRGDYIALVKGDSVDIPDVEYRIEYTLDKQVDIQRIRSVTVASGTNMKHTVAAYADFLNDTITVMTVAGGYSDYGTDADGDGYYDYLTIKVGVDVTSAGWYRVSGDLYDKNWSYIEHGYYYGYLDTGSQTVELIFDGMKIRRNGVDGPFYLRYIYLYDDYYNQLDYEYEYETSAYNYTQFQKSPAELVGFYDYPVDINNDTYYDYLTIEAFVNVSTNGTYRVEGSLYDAEWNYIDYKSNETYLTTDVNAGVIKLNFDGKTIRVSGVNGSLYLYTYLYNASYKLSEDKYRTHPYYYEDFSPPKSDKEILQLSWTYKMQSGVTRMQFGASPAIADLNSGTPSLEIVTGSDEYSNYYPELEYWANGIWRAFDSQGNLLWARDTETDEARTSVAVVDIDNDTSLEIVGGTTSGWNVEVIHANGSFMWTFPSPPMTGGPFMWHSSPAVADVDPNVSGLEVIIGNNPYGNVWAFDGDNSDGVNDGISVDLSSWYYPGGSVGEEGKDWDVLWKFETGGNIVSTPAIGDIDDDGQLEVVIGSGDGYVYALNAANGTLEWKHLTSSWYAVDASAGLADFDDDGDLEVVIGSTDGNVYFIDGDEDGNGIIDDSEVYTYYVGAVYSSPAIGDVDGDGDLEIIIGSADGRVYSFDYKPSTANWYYQTNGSIYSSPALANRSGGGLDIYIGSEDGYLYLLSGTTGKMIDRFGAFGPIRTSPSVADIDGDGKLEITFVDWHEPDYLWVLKDNNSSVGSYSLEWPMFRGNADRSGLYGS
jgi:hypothetical protein